MFASPRASSLLAFGLSLFFTFTTASAVGLDTQSHLAVPGDFNGDGRMDALLQPLSIADQGAIVLQDGTGNLTVLAQGWDPGYLGLDWSTGASTLTSADLNGDGQDDVIVQPRKAGGTAAVLITDPTVQFLQISQLLPQGYLGLDWSSASHVIVAGDFDGDRHKELLMLAAKRAGTGALVHADADGHLVAVMQPFADGFLGRHWDMADENVYVGDFNGDGRADLLVQSRLALRGESAYALLLADPDGRFSHIAETWNLKDLGADWNPATHKILIEDANHDGIMDIVVQSTTGGSNYVFTGNAQGEFIQPAAHWTGNKSASDVLNTGTSKAGGGISVVISPKGPTAETITAPSNPEQNQTSPQSGQRASGSGTIMTVNAAGTLAGSGGVSGGTATYSIPIALPPGRAGMQPSVSLSYSSRGGNGEMGMGWSLSAGSQIHRCPATMAMDGYSTGVSYTPTDRLCLDGQHLTLVSGTYGSAGAVYRTELDNFSRITQNSTLTDPSNSFTVVTKSGHTLGYGASSGLSGTNAVFTPSGASAPLAWGLDIELDTYNNSIIYYYSTFGTGEYLLTSIKYTGTGNTAGSREVDFSYNTRGDVSSQYVGGGLTTQSQLLSTVTTKVSGQVVRTYSTDYLASAATGRTLLNGVQECAGSGSSQACLPETTFTWQNPATHFADPSNVDANDPCGTGPAIPNQQYLYSPGDVNGDGFKDVIYNAGCKVYLYLMGPGGLQKGSFTDITNVFSIQASYVVDIDGDGAADLVGPMSDGTLGYATYTASGGPFTNAQSLGIPYNQTINRTTYQGVVDIKDVDGDGLPDIVVLMQDTDPTKPNNHMLAVYLNTTQPCTASCPATVTFSNTPLKMLSEPDYTDQYGNFYTLSASSAGDMDGNGLPDFNVVYTDSSGLTHHQWEFTLEDSSGHLSFNNLDWTTVGGGGGMNLDINGDGLPDMVYDCTTSRYWCYRLNTGKIGSSMFGAEVNTGIGDSRAGVQLTGSFVADYDNDGLQEIMIPGGMLAEYCDTDYMKNINGTWEPVTACAQSGLYQLPPGDDFSVYQYYALKFVPQSNGSGGVKYVPTLISTSVKAQANLASAIDLAGDGLTGIVSPFTKWYQFGRLNNIGSYVHPNGPSVALNTSGSTNSLDAAQDLMLSATDGFNHQDQWDYYPLSSTQQYHGLALYDTTGNTAHGTNGYQGADYFNFTSSMYVVGEYRASNGVGTMNAHDFHYGQAIYNNQGRGFQGFRTVVDDDDTSGARTVQVYHQRFPLSGTLAESWTTTQADSVDLTAADPVFPVTAPGAGGHAISHVVNTWGCMQGTQTQMTVRESTNTIISCERSKLDASTYVPVLKESLETHYDVNSHDQLSQTDTHYCLASGLACTGSTSTRGYDMYGNGLGSLSVTTDAYGTYSSSTANTYDTPDTSAWWVNKLKVKTTVVDAVYGSASDQGGVSRETDYTYNASRSVATVTSLPGTPYAKLITYVYGDSKGNVTSATVSGTSSTSPSIAARSTTTDYTTSGYYFPNVVTDPAGLKVTTNFDSNTGEPLNVTAQDGTITTNTYDGFGRKTSTQLGSLPAQVIQYITHVTHDGMCDGTTAYVGYYVLMNQTGYPGHYTCYDSLNRAIRTVTESFATQSENVYVGTNYDAHGHVVGITEAHFASQSSIWNTEHYDYSNILGRMDYQVDAKGVETDYSYSDLVATIKTKTPNDQLNPGYERDDQEVKNSLGKMMSVSNATNDSNQIATTSYSYDSDGNPITITAADGTTINAVYDVLGHKTDVTDPDQGHTHYTYDVLGELLTQTDAKSQTLTMTYDVDGRMLSKVAPEGTTLWCYDGTTYSTGTCTGSVSTVAKGKLSSVGQSSDGYQENYSFDSLGRVTRDEEVISGTTYDTDTAYDTDGRVDTVTYPSSIADATPVANAGSTQYVLPGATVTLNGSGSSDPDGGPQPLAYQWSQTSGPAVSLSSATAVSPTFTAGAVGTSYAFQLTADDGLSSSNASVTVNVPALPVAPTGLTDTGDTNHDGSYTVSWNTVSVPGTTITYHLEEAGGTSSGPTQSYSEIYSGSTASAAVSHPGNGYYYYWYRVRAEDKLGSTSIGYGAYSATDNIHEVVTPGEPSSISPANGSSSTGSYTISWGAYTGSLPAADVYYQLYESTASNFSGQYQVYSGTSRSYSTHQTQLLDFYYEVSACNSNGSVTVCSPYRAKAHIIVTGTGGQQQAPVKGGTQAPAPTTNTGPTGAVLPVMQPIPELSPNTPIQELAITTVTAPVMRAASRHSMHQTHHVLPRFAPPVYQAWADAHVQATSGTTPIVRFAVKHIYTANGYLWQLVSAVDPNRIYWKVNEFAGGSGNTDSAGNFYEHGMDAHGNPTDVYLGGGAVMTHYGYNPNSGYLASIKSTTQDGNTIYQSQGYQWFAIGNLYSRTSNPTVDNVNTLTETFGYDLHNRVLSSTVNNGSGSQTPVVQTYDSVGDISTKSDVGAYIYTGGSGGPHAVKTAGSNSYSYDADGNMQNRAGTNLDWNSDNLPTCIDAGGGHCTASTNSAFSYAPDKHRYRQVSMTAGVTQTTLYLGGLVIVQTGSVTHYQHTLTAYGRSVYLDDLSNGTTSPSEARSVLLTDHLGSVETIVDVSSSARGHQSFGAFGCHRDPGTWQCQTGGSTATDNQHGYTDHEDLGTLGLVHMNGRVYDPAVGRFLSVDPVYQAPTNTQSVNPYSYVMNNPLSLVDPSGYAGAAPPDAANASNQTGGPSVVLIDTIGGSLGGEGGRDSKGNLIQNVDLSTLQAGEGVRLANGTSIIMNADGTVDAFDGNGAVLGTGIALPKGGGSTGNENSTDTNQSGIVAKTALKACDAHLPASSDGELLSKTLFAEATRSNSISIGGSNTELAAIAYSAVNRVDDLQDPDVSLGTYGATSRSLSGVINATQYHSFGDSNFNLAADPSKISTADRVGRYNCALLKRAITTAVGVLNGSIKDPYEAQGGTFGMRTAGHGAPGGNYSALPAIHGSNNTFYTLSDDGP